MRSTLFHCCTRGAGLRIALTLGLVAVLFTPWSEASAQTPVAAGYRDFSFGTVTNSAPTGEKPESKLWWNDGSWWGTLFESTSQTFHIYKFNATAQSWIDTGTVLDDRAYTKADCLWDDASQKLYVASHVFSTTASSTTSNSSGRLYRFSYDPATQKYTKDPGFPVTINSAKTETLTIAKDSVGVLWVTWIEDNKVMVNHSSGDDTVWRTPYVLPTKVGAATSTTSDDISNIIAFGGGHIGVMWSNQVNYNGKESFYFAVHNDGDPDITWQREEIAYSGPNIADDHINLKTDLTGNIYAVVKTSLIDSASPLIVLLVRDSGGIWTNYQVATEEWAHTRPIVLLDTEHKRIYVFATAPTNGGIIYYKFSPMSPVAFDDGLGAMFIKSSKDTSTNNATSTKQNVTSKTGLLVLASNPGTTYYLHNLMKLGGSTQFISSFTPASGPPGVKVSINGSGFSGATSVSFNGTLAASFTVVSDSQVQATVPNGARTGPITILTPSGSITSADSFTVTGTATPTITSLTPAKGPLGSAVTIAGTNFLGTSNVSFNSVSATFSVISDTQIQTTVPAGATTGPVSVTNALGTGMSTSNFNVTPAVTSFLPTSGTIGTFVTISGTSFSAATGVKFGTAAVTSFTVNSDTQISATVPNGATTGKITVTTPSGSGTSSAKFTVNLPPTITSFSPSNGPVGTQVTVYGASFTGTAAVKFNGTAANFTITSDTQLQTTVPAQATSGTIVITNATGTTTSATAFNVSSSGSFTYTPAADSYVNSSNVGVNYGTAIGLKLRNGDEANPITYQSYMKFNVTDLSGPVTTAKLRIYISDPSTNSTMVWGTTDAWTETGLTWSNAPGPSTAQPYATVAPAVLNTWMEFSLPVQLFAAGNGMYDLLLTSSGTDSVGLSSREGANPPQLVLTQ